MQQTTALSWYREPWVWFILILFFSAITSAVVMTYIAIQHTPTEVEWQDNHASVLTRNIT